MFVMNIKKIVWPIILWEKLKHIWHLQKNIYGKRPEMINSTKESNLPELIVSVLFHSRPENFKKSRQKNSWNQINQFRELWSFGSFKFFPSSTIGFLAIIEMKLQKINFFREIDLFDFKSFYSWNEIWINFTEFFLIFL